MTGRLRLRRTFAKARKDRPEQVEAMSPCHDGAKSSANVAQAAEAATERERLLSRLEASQVG